MSDKARSAARDCDQCFTASETRTRHHGSPHAAPAAAKTEIQRSEQRERQAGSRDLNLVPSGSYPAEYVEPFTYTFLPDGADSAPTVQEKDLAYAAGRDAIKAKKYALAAAKFESWAQLFVDDPRIGTAQYYAGTARLQVGERWAAIEWLSRMQEQDPEHPWYVYASYWLGEAYAGAGLCGSALPYFESVAWSDQNIDAAFRDAAKNNITRLNEDQGVICDDWNW